jgi:hypothetical protein
MIKQTASIGLHSTCLFSLYTSYLTLKMEAILSSETSMNCQTTRRRIQEVNTICNHCFESLKSKKKHVFLVYLTTGDRRTFDRVRGISLPAMRMKLRHRHLMTLPVTSLLELNEFCFQHAPGIRMPLRNSYTLTEEFLFRKVAYTRCDVEWMDSTRRPTSHERKHAIPVACLIRKVTMYLESSVHWGGESIRQPEVFVCSADRRLTQTSCSLVCDYETLLIMSWRHGRRGNCISVVRSRLSLFEYRSRRRLNFASSLPIFLSFSE